MHLHVHSLRGGRGPGSGHARRGGGAHRATFALAAGLVLAATLGSPLALAQDAPATETQPWPLPVVATEHAVALVPWLEGLALPVSVTSLAPERDGVLVVGLEGVVVLASEGVVRPTPFLDLRHRVTGLEGEQGLFTVAVEPAARAARLGRPRQVVAAFTEIGTGDLIVAAYPVDEATWTADATAEVVVLRVPMPEPFHHGGQVRFGPDGLLYVSVGNGERSPDYWTRPPWSAQALDTLRGKLVRIDLLPHGAGAVGAYAVPADNPFVATDGALGEIWAVGFRNPWKFAFVDDGPRLLVADVGEDRWEEVNLVAAGDNAGWPVREGPECLVRFDAAAWVDPSCPERDLNDPWLAVPHLPLDPDGAQAVVGGVVVRDPDLPWLAGRYVFGDFVTGRVWAYEPGAAALELLLDTDLAITAIEPGPAGEVLLAAIDGRVLRLVPTPR